MLEYSVVLNVEKDIKKVLPPGIDIIREFRTIRNGKVDFVLVNGFEILACIEVKADLSDRRLLANAQKQVKVYQKDTHSYWAIVTDGNRYYIQSIANDKLIVGINILAIGILLADNSLLVACLIVKSLTAESPTAIDVCRQNIPLPLFLNTKVYTVDNPRHRNLVGVVNLHLVSIACYGHNIVSYIYILLEELLLSAVHFCDGIRLEAAVVHGVEGGCIAEPLVEVWNILVVDIVVLRIAAYIEELKVGTTQVE